MRSEEEKMLAGEPYDAHCPEMCEMRTKTAKILQRLNVTEAYSGTVPDIMRELCPNSAPDLHLEPPFICEYGRHIHAGPGVFIHTGAIFLDGGTITIGENSYIGPGVQIYTAGHPVDVAPRREWEYCHSVKIGRDCRIGGHVTICPGITIGDRVVIGAGAVVVKDIPDDTVAAGNPARVLHKRQYV